MQTTVKTVYLSLLCSRFWVIQGDSVASNEVSAEEEEFLAESEKVVLKERVSMSKFRALGSFERTVF